MEGIENQENVANLKDVVQNQQQQEESTQNEPTWTVETDDIKDEVQTEEVDLTETKESTTAIETTREAEKEVENKVEEVKQIEINEDLAYEYLAKKQGLTVEVFKNNLTPKEEKHFAPEMEAFDKFIKETGNSNYNDFLEIKKDWSTVSDEEKVKSWIKSTNPRLTKEQRDFLYEEEYSIEDLDTDDDNREIQKRQIKLTRDSEIANMFFEQRKKDFSVVRGSDDYVPIEYREAKKQVDSLNSQNELVQEIRTDFVSKTESFFNKDFKGFEVKVGNETDGFLTLNLTPENVEEVKNFQKDSNNLMSDFIDAETGKIKNLEEYHLAMYMAKNYKSELNKARMQGRAEQIVIFDKISKNIQPDNPTISNQNVATDRVWEVV